MPGTVWQASCGEWMVWGDNLSLIASRRTNCPDARGWGCHPPSTQKHPRHRLPQHLSVYATLPHCMPIPHISCGTPPAAVTDEQQHAKRNTTNKQQDCNSRKPCRALHDMDHYHPPTPPNNGQSACYSNIMCHCSCQIVIMMNNNTKKHLPNQPTTTNQFPPTTRNHHLPPPKHQFPNTQHIPTISLQSLNPQYAPHTVRTSQFPLQNMYIPPNPGSVEWQASRTTCGSSALQNHNTSPTPHISPTIACILII